MHKFCELYAWPSVVEQPVLELPGDKNDEQLARPGFPLLSFYGVGEPRTFLQRLPNRPGSRLLEPRSLPTSHRHLAFVYPAACQPAIGTWHLSGAVTREREGLIAFQF